MGGLPSLRCVCRGIVDMSRQGALVVPWLDLFVGTVLYEYLAGDGHRVVVKRNGLATVLLLCLYTKNGADWVGGWVKPKRKRF